MDSNILRDRTLVLRILDESLEAELRDKMARAQEDYQANPHSTSNSSTGTSQTKKPMRLPQHLKSPSPSLLNSEGSVLNLEGVTCEPSIQPPRGGGTTSLLHRPNQGNSASTSNESDPTLWTFVCDGASYPARLINLPNPIEIHKTHDHAMYYKCIDVAQMLIVYSDTPALEEAESMPGYKINEFPSYYHSGLTQPMQNVVKERFAMREHNGGSMPSVEEIREVEGELIDLVNKISLKEGKGKGRGGGNAASGAGKVWEEIEEEVVPYEPWMLNGIEFDEGDDICKLHPEVWLSPTEEEKDSNVLEEGGQLLTKKGADSTSTSKPKQKKSRKSTSGKPKTNKGKKKAQKEATLDSPAPSPVPPPPLPPTADLDEVDFDIGLMDEFGEDDDLGVALDLDDLI